MILEMKTTNVNGTLWKSFEKKAKKNLSEDFPIREREYLISDLYTMYDLKMIEMDQFRGTVALLTAGSEDAVMGMMIVKNLRRDKRYRLYIKLNRRLPFARSIHEEGLMGENKCPVCGLMHKSVSAINKQCPAHASYEGYRAASSPNGLYMFLRTDPSDDLFVAACRSIQQTVRR